MLSANFKFARYKEFRGWIPSTEKVHKLDNLEALDLECSRSLDIIELEAGSCTRGMGSNLAAGMCLDAPHRNSPGSGMGLGLSGHNWSQGTLQVAKGPLVVLNLLAEARNLGNPGIWRHLEGTGSLERDSFLSKQRLSSGSIAKELGEGIGSVDAEMRGRRQQIYLCCGRAKLARDALPGLLHRSGRSDAREPSHLDTLGADKEDHAFDKTT